MTNYKILFYKNQFKIKAQFYSCSINPNGAGHIEWSVNLPFGYLLSLKQTTGNSKEMEGLRI